MTWEQGWYRAGLFGQGGGQEDNQTHGAEETCMRGGEGDVGKGGREAQPRVARRP